MPFVTLNCAAVPAELIESELFGHEKGAFTGAAAKHLGKFEQADGGTLFLDEIGDMPVAMQAKLLRVLEEGEVERVGGDKPIQVNVRVIVATHRNLEDLVKQNAFRRDLFHRIYVFRSSCRRCANGSKIFRVLVEHFARQVAAQNGWKEKVFAKDAHRRIAPLRLARKYPRITKCRRAIGPARRRRADRRRRCAPDFACLRQFVDALKTQMRNLSHSLGSGTLAERTEQFEREVLLAEIRRQNFHMTNVARSMGLERSHLYKKCQQLGIDLASMRKVD